MAINHFSQLSVWQLSREFAVNMYSHMLKLPVSEKYGLISQIQRAATSVPANIAEGFTRRTKPEKVQFYTVALGSLTETESHLYVALDLKYIDKQKFMDCVNDITQIRKLLHGLIKSAVDKPR